MRKVIFAQLVFIEPDIMESGLNPSLLPPTTTAKPQPRKGTFSQTIVLKEIDLTWP
jgi:hypothetical protein